MKITILQEKLKEGLNIVEKISAKSLTLPILNNILFSTEKNFLNLSSTDLEIGIRWWSLAKVEKQGKVTIPSKILSGFISFLPNEKIEIEALKNNLFITCKNHKTQIIGMDAEEFPIIPKVSETESILINIDLFCGGLASVADIASPSTARPEISGVYLFFDGKSVTLTATDSFRLGEKIINPEKQFNLKNDYALIIPQKTAREIINIFSGKEGDLKIYFSPNQVMFERQMTETNHPQIQLVSRVIDGTYPDYQEIIPKKFTTTLNLSKIELLNQIKSAGLFSGKSSEVKIKTHSKKNSVEISSQSSDLGEYNSSMPAKIKGSDLSISFNHKYLLDGIASLKSSEILFELSGDSGPGVLRPVGDKSFLYIVMPVKSV